MEAPAATARGPPELSRRGPLALGKDHPLPPPARQEVHVEPVGVQLDARFPGGTADPGGDVSWQGGLLLASPRDFRTFLVGCEILPKTGLGRYITLAYSGLNSPSGISMSNTAGLYVSTTHPNPIALSCMNRQMGRPVLLSTIRRTSHRSNPRVTT